MNVGENIRVGLMPNSLIEMIRKPADQKRELELALSVGLDADDLARHPSELPMGNLRKLELARTLATNPQVVLLDEVFAGLTAGEIEQITELLYWIMSKYDQLIWANPEPCRYCKLTTLMRTTVWRERLTALV